MLFMCLSLTLMSTVSLLLGNTIRLCVSFSPKSEIILLAVMALFGPVTHSFCTTCLLEDTSER